MSAALAIGAAARANDLAAIEVLPERGQTAEQARRDRYECHNWAVAQTGAVPPRYDAEQEAGERRAERIDKVLLGAGVGAAVGAIVRGNDSRRGDEAADGAIGGAVLGAAVGALLGRGKADDSVEDEAFDAYTRALGACLEGRGYRMIIGSEAAQAERSARFEGV